MNCIKSDDIKGVKKFICEEFLKNDEVYICALEHKNIGIFLYLMEYKKVSPGTWSNILHHICMTNDVEVFKYISNYEKHIELHHVVTSLLKNNHDVSEHILRVHNLDFEVFKTCFKYIIKYSFPDFLDEILDRTVSMYKNFGQELLGFIMKVQIKSCEIWPQKRDRAIIPLIQAEYWYGDLNPDDYIVFLDEDHLDFFVEDEDMIKRIMKKRRNYSWPRDLAISFSDVV